MESTLTFLSESWLALLLLLLALGCSTLAVVQHRRRGGWSWRWYLPALVLFGYAVGAFDFLPEGVGMALALTAVGMVVFLLILVLINGFWLPLLGYALALVFFFGLGSATGRLATDGLSTLAWFLLSLRPLEPWWLLLLLLIPLLILLFFLSVVRGGSFGSLMILGPTRSLLALGLRCLLIIFLAFALAEMHARKPHESVAVLFVWDRSLSMPPEVQAGRDLREERLLDFINQSVSLRGGKHMNDRAGVIVFGKHPKLELPPSNVPRLGFKKILSEVDRSYTDISAALKLALASFPEGAGKRIVLISDGNENIGNAEEQARIARHNGVQIDVVPIAAARQQHNEILVERIEAPSVTEKEARLPIRVVVRSYHPQVVVARLNLRKMTFDPARDAAGNNHEAGKNSLVVKLRQGLNVYYFQQQSTKEDTVHAYEASVVPLRVETPEGALVHQDLPGDRIDNNAARAVVIARGERTLLLLEPKSGDHQLLVNRLRATAKSGLKVVPMMPEQMRQLTVGDPEKLATFLSKFDAVILANIPAESLSEEEQKVFRSSVHDQGAGLIMIGGNQSFGAGGWQNTEIEKALPVNMELKSMKIEGKSGLVLMMHASEMAEGNAWQHKIAKLAVEKLSPMDMIGMIHYDHGIQGGQPGHRWHIPFQEIAGNRKRILGRIDSMEPGDMPDVDPAFEKAYKELTDPEYQLGTKHIIFISDGDHWDASWQMLQKIRRARITCTTVCITTHGANEVKKMAAVARATGGRDYFIQDPKELPRIYIQESRLVSQSFVHEKKFGPRLMSRQGPTEGLQDQLPPLYGFVRTTPRDSSLVQVLIETPKIGEYKFPILASWQYGLGKSIAFTSDARTLAQGSTFWDKDWASADLYAKFWEQAVDWVVRPVETGKHLFLTTEHRDGKIRVTVEAQELDKTPLTEITLKAGISSPTFKIKDERKQTLKFEQKNSGVYEAEFPADEVGAYFINIQASWKKDGQEVTDNVRAGVTIPYSPEFAEMESNPALLEKIAAATSGKIYIDEAGALAASARSTEVFRPVPHSYSSLQTLWPWLVFLAALCLLLDVAIRRIALQPEVVWSHVVARWRRLRGLHVDEPVPAFIERLKSRKAQVEETLAKQKAGRKFESAAGSTAAGTPASPDAPMVAPIGSAPPSGPAPAKNAPEPKKEEQQEDFATRLMRAKKKAMEERDKDKPK